MIRGGFSRARQRVLALSLDKLRDTLTVAVALVAQSLFADRQVQKPLFGDVHRQLLYQFALTMEVRMYEPGDVVVLQVRPVWTGVLTSYPAVCAW